MKPESLKVIFAKLGGKSQIAQWCGVTFQAVVKWEKRDKFPRTEYTGETNYAKTISEKSNGLYSVDFLLKK